MLAQMMRDSRKCSSTEVQQHGEIIFGKHMERNKQLARSINEPPLASKERD